MKQIFAMAIAAALSACVSTPKETYQYYPAKSATTLVVTQALDCTTDQKDGTKIDFVVTSSVQTPNTAYSADYLHGPYPLDISALDGTLSDNDTAATFTPDGRLLTINATSTGEGETILKSAISLGSAVAAFAAPVALMSAEFPQPLIKGIGRANPKPKKPIFAPGCKTIMRWPGFKDHKVALTFTRIVNLAKLAEGEAISLTNTATDPGIAVSDWQLYNALSAEGAKLPNVYMKIGFTKIRQPAEYKGTADGMVEITLQKTQSAAMTFSLDQGDGTGHWSAASTAVIPDAINGNEGTFQLAVPKGKAFGNGKVALTISDAGQITSLEYNKTNGAAGPMNVATAAVQAATPAPADTPPPPAALPTPSSSH